MISERSLVANKLLGPENRTRVIRDGRWLIVKFPEPQSVVSWAIVRGGQVIADTVASFQVDEAELIPPVDPVNFLKDELHRSGLSGAIGLMTSRQLDSYVDIEESYQGISVRAVVTAGLANALRAGDPPGTSGKIGTINVVCHVSVPLSEEAMLESMALAVEARTVAVLESGVTSRQTHLPATGTGTDCLVIAAPVSKCGIKYAGKHTAIGHLIGSTVLKATERGVAIWKCERDSGLIGRRNLSRD